MSRLAEREVVELSTKFFDTVFSDQFIFAEAFGKDRAAILAKSRLSSSEKELAERIADSNLYNEENWEACDTLCQELSLVYNWQSNSEGPLIFASKVLYLLREQGQDVGWFIQQLMKPDKKGSIKKIRATVILETSDGFMITKSPKGEWLLPGGNKKRGELPICAAVRELYEETKLQTTDIRFLFKHESQYYMHHVFLVRGFTGSASPSSDAQQLLYIKANAFLAGEFPKKLSHSNKEILHRYISSLGQD